jgi:hypothetical protein
LDDDDDDFAPGVLVKVTFYTDENGVHFASKIEAKYKVDDDDDEDDDDSHRGREGHAYGIVEKMPEEGDLDAWIISGIVYIVNERTELDDDDSIKLDVGVRVKVEYYVNGEDKRVAKEIETTDEDGGPSQEGYFKSYGFVNEKPGNGLFGSWVIDGATFVADQNTIVDEQRGLLAVGAYTEVEYRMANGRNYVKKIQVHVPPGAGDDDKLGRIESIQAATRSLASTTASIWVIDGVSYTVIAATSLKDNGGTLTVGGTVQVNSYTDTNGNQIATQVQSITLNNSTYLPVLRR